MNELEEFFKDVDDALFLDVLDMFTVGDLTSKNEKATRLLTEFLIGAGIFDSYKNINHDQNNPKQLFTRASHSDREVIITLLHQFYKEVPYRLKKRIKADKKRESKNKKGFNYLKSSLLEMFRCLNENESYFFSKDEDSTKCDEIASMKYE